MTYKISDSKLDLINDITILYDKTPILSSKFYEFLEKKHPGESPRPKVRGFLVGFIN